MARVKPILLAAMINLALLAAVDLILVKLDVLSPPFQYGLRDVGFGYPGVRASEKLGAPPLAVGTQPLTIAMVGDSHSQLVFKNPLDTHEFVLERVLRGEGIPANVISAGRGRYSPLQEYVLYTHELKHTYHPRVLLMNVYSGNDFYDMLRPDDRPHFERDDRNAIVMKGPRWISFVDPGSRSWIQRSRILWGIDELASRLGYPRVVTRLRMLGAAVDRSPVVTARYLSNLARSQEPRLVYPAGFAAQFLNQALYFQHYPASQAESIAFMRHLLAQVRAENPDTLLVMSSIPSAALMKAMPRDIDQLWRDTLARTGLTEEWVADLENTLVDQLETASIETGWIFVDLRDCLRGRFAEGELFSSSDLHINDVASRLIGACQARALLSSPGFTNLLGARAHPGEATD